MPARTLQTLAAGLLVTGTMSVASAQDPPRKRRPPEEAARVHELLAELDRPSRSAQAMNELVDMGRAAVPFLIEALESEDGSNADKAAEMLRFLGPGLADAAGPRLRRLARSEDRKVQRRARWALVAFPTGNDLLVAAYDSGSVLLLREGEEPEVVIGALQSVWDVEPVPSGGHLITQYSPPRIWERGPEGEELWSYAGVRDSLDSDRLVDGNTLVADTNGKRVLEVDPGGQIVWQKNFQGGIYDVERLPNGHTLVAVYPKRVVELDVQRRVVWEVDQLEGVFDADRLPNGDTLLTLYGRGAVRIVDRKGQTVREIAGIKRPNEADMLPGGHIRVTVQGAVLEFDGTGKEVRRWNVPGRVARVWQR